MRHIANYGIRNPKVRKIVKLIVTFFVRKMGSVETKGTLQKAGNDAGRNGYPYFLSGFILPDPEFAPPRLNKIANSSAGRPLERSRVTVGLLAAISAASGLSVAFWLGRRSLRGLNFCRFGVLVDCAHDASAAEQGQRCGNESKFLHCFRFTSFRFERISGKAVHGLIASITAETT